MLQLMTATASWADSDAVLGAWQTENDESTVAIFRCGEKLCGRIVWLKTPTYTDSRDGPVGTPVLDRKNPDPALRNRPVLGLQVLEGFVEQGADTWGGGTCYDPKSGNTYRGKIRLVAPDRLELRGFVGISLFGRSSEWTRRNGTRTDSPR
jgi:uncharacterized protein (DUF2147 family)